MLSGIPSATFLNKDGSVAGFLSVIGPPNNFITRIKSQGIHDDGR
jgi:hypothetical protein